MLEQDLACRLVHIPNETQTEEEAAESVLLVVHFLFLCIDPLLISSEVAEFANEHFIGFQLFGGEDFIEPGEGNLLVGHDHRNIADPQRPADQVLLGCEDAVQIRNRLVGVKVAR